MCRYKKKVLVGLHEILGALLTQSASSGFALRGGVIQERAGVEFLRVPAVCRIKARRLVKRACLTPSPWESALGVGCSPHARYAAA